MDSITEVGWSLVVTQFRFIPAGPVTILKLVSSKEYTADEEVRRA
ncbi:hypothetical protein ACFRMQ_31815 [Kitasatospora sp. NPDC056783]